MLALSASPSCISISLSPAAQGGNGYEEMHRYLKQGEEFCKEMENIITER